MIKIKFYILFIFLLSNVIESDEFISTKIQTTSGISTGNIHNGVIGWDDIPYAKPPIDDLRWKSPQKILNRENIILPKDDNFCIQRPSGLGGVEGDGYFTGSEDCLYLDIKAPYKSNENLPVMFWIHGGGNTSGLKDLYDFSKMVKRHDVIVITINYRLGPFGWFTHPAIQDFQDGIDKTSNFGTLDIISALEWVQSNIKLFGGDPNNVTIFGESAGGHNVLSLLVSKYAKGLFHKSIVQSGYTTSISPEEAYKQENYSSTSDYTSNNVVKQILNSQTELPLKKELADVRYILKNMPAKEFFSYYSERSSYQELPLLTSDGIVIPEIPFRDALSSKNYVNIVPTIAGSNRDEVKLWLASAEYFVKLDYSILGTILNVPKVKLRDKKAFNIFNSYRSMAWKIRGVDHPLESLYSAGNQNLYAYRYDWDDHRRLIIANFKTLIGAAHATEIPLITGNNKLVGEYGFLIYPRGPSKRFLSKNMMKFWTNFAKYGQPGKSSNSIEWLSYKSTKDLNSNYLILDNRRNLRMGYDNFSFKSLSNDLYKETDVTDLEKCVVLLQMFTFVGDDLYDENIKHYPGVCNRSLSENFLKENASFIDY